MENFIGICGLICNNCGAFIATLADDDDLRRETAENWSMMYNVEIRAVDINCDGCTSNGGVHFNYCSKCEIRACGLKHKVDSCAHCPEYICDKLANFIKIAPEARNTLDEIRQTTI